LAQDRHEAATDPTLRSDEIAVGGPAAPSAQAEDHAGFVEVPPAHYAMGDEVARGGMGRIRLARDRRLHRRVAVKELLEPSEADQARFAREALITARLQHPSIVRVYEAGRWPSGRPFYAMEWVEGRSFDQVIAAARNLDERLGLLPHVQKVAEALAYAHAQRIIHRDLKPSNVIVGSYGETVVIDWGLAKDLAGPADEAPSARPFLPTSDALTVAGAVMGTPAYMPPEQARGAVVDERADVYAIGAILYATLSGRAPFSGPSAHEVLAQVLAGPPPPLPTLEPGVPADLAAVVDKAMAADPPARYASAGELAEDLKRFATGQLVKAHRYSRATLIKRWLRRHRAPVAVAGLSLAILVGLGAAAVRRIIVERNRAEGALAAAERAEREAAAERDRAVARTEQLLLDQAKAALERDPSLTLAWLKELDAGSARWPEARELAREAARRGVAHVLSAHGDDVEHVALTPDGRTLLSAGDDHAVYAWDLTTFSPHLLGKHDSVVESLRLSPDGKRAASASVDHAVIVWDPSTGDKKVLAGHTATVRDAAFSPDGRSLASGAEDKTVRLWNLAGGGARVLYTATSDVRTLDFSPDGRRLVAGTESGLVVLIDLPGGVVHGLGAHQGTVRLARYSPDGKQVLTGSEDGTARLAPTAAGAAAVLGGHGDMVRAVAFSPDGGRVATGGGDGVVRLWSAAGVEERALAGHRSAIKQVLFAPDGKRLASASYDGTVRLWDVADGKCRILSGHGAAVKSIVFGPDGRHLASGSDDDRVRWWRLEGAREAPADGAELLHWLDEMTNLRVHSPAEKK
jgi:WD40 repeat protein